MLCLSVASACGDAHPALAEAAAVAVELLHCASLIYDDLPCFDDAAVRRGSPSVHVAHGEELAILAGNALIVQAFDSLARASTIAATTAATTATPRAATTAIQLLPGLIRVIARGVGSPSGIAAGQAWESETPPDLGTYHRAKTGALFESAIIAGALAGGGDPLQWTGLGHRLGEAYQVADDLRDSSGRADLIGKPVNQDALLGRPSAVRELGHAGALARLGVLCDEVVARLPACAGRHDLIGFVRSWQADHQPQSCAAAAP